MTKMDAQELIRYISEAEKKTPVKIYIKEKRPIDYGDAKVAGAWPHPRGQSGRHRGYGHRKRPAEFRPALAGH